MRHISVESPDGSVCIAFNEEVPPPAIEEPQIKMRRTIGLQYNPVSKLMMYLLFLTSLFLAVWIHRLVDMVNLTLVSATNVSLYLEKCTYSIVQPTLHGTVSGLMVVPFCVLKMWGQGAYQIGCAIACLFVVYTSKDITEEFIVQHPDEIP